MSPTTSELLLIADRSRPRTLQREIGPSDLGSCRRKVGYKLAGVEPVNAVGSVVAMIGTSVHDAVAKAVPSVAKPGDLVEHEVTYAGITGHLDRYEADVQEAIDTKTCSSRMAEHHKLHGPPHSHIWQLSFYAAGLIEQGHPVRRIRLEYLTRDTGEEWVYSQRFNIEDVRDALTWLKTVRDTDVDMLPRDYLPDTTFCLTCPFGGEDGGVCWAGHVEGRGLATALYVDNPDAAAWAEELWAAREAKREPTESEKRAKAALMAVCPPLQTVQCGDRYLRLTANNRLMFVSGPRAAEFSL